METPTSEEEVHRLLLVADEVFRGDDIARELSERLGEGSRVEIFLVAPAIAHNRVDQELGNIDVTGPQAEERLEAMVRELNEAGLNAAAEVGDADPLVAIDDGLARFPADEIVVVSHVDGAADPAEEGLWARLRSDYHQPVTQIRVGERQGAEPPAVEQVEHAPAHQETREEEIRQERNFPPMNTRAVAGILFGFVGTVLLGLIAVAIGTDDDGNLTGDAAVVLLIAIGAFLINVAHVVGLLFFESVRYRGFWEKFMARLSIGVTSVGLVAALALWLF